MNCTLLLVGTELLNGATIDTNSIYMAEELNKYGIGINYKLTVGDSLNKIIDAIIFGKENSDLVIMSGGLGPTDDDLTKTAVSKYLNKKLIVDNDELEELKEKFAVRGIEFLNKNLKEVEKPEGAISIKNDVGMAPAFFIDGIVGFPGVPRELKNMFPKFLKMYSEKMNLNIDPIYVKDLLTIGIPESILEEKIKSLFEDPNIEYEFLIKDYGIIVRMQSKLSNKNTVEKIKEKIYNITGDYIFGEDNERLETKVVKLLSEKNYSISVAESCSGGMLAEKLISVPGISKIFKEGIVSYSNEAKINRLNIEKKRIDEYGAVSKEIAKDMLDGLNSDVAISITGFAGPTGGTEEKPVGRVYIGIKVNDKNVVFEHNFKGDRNRVRAKAVLQSLFELCKILEEDE